MRQSSRSDRGPRKAPRPLDSARLNELALAYVARFATTAAGLEAYLARKLRERGWDDERPADPSGIAARFVAAGYIDDEAWARAKTGSLLRRGYGERRIGEALARGGIAASIREDVRAGEAASRAAALTMARKRGFGPFGKIAPDRAAREKQIAAMLRAGHRLDSARELVNAACIDAAEEWAAAAEADE